MRAASVALVALGIPLMMITSGAHSEAIVSVELPGEWGKYAKEMAEEAIAKLSGMLEQPRREAIARLVTGYVAVAAAKREFAQAIENGTDGQQIKTAASHIKKSIDALGKVIQNIDPTWVSASTANLELDKQIQKLQQEKISLINKTITTYSNNGESVQMDSNDAKALAQAFREEADSLEKLAEKIVTRTQ